MAAAIKEAKGIEATLIAGKGGIFDVAIEGKVVYSKFDTDKFPSHEEIISQL